MKFISYIIIFISISLFGFGIYFTYHFFKPTQTIVEIIPEEIEPSEEPIIIEEGPIIVEIVEEDPVEIMVEEEVNHSHTISLGIYKVTAYCGCAKCCGNTDGITASGTHVTAGRTVAAPSNLPFGTQLVINGHTYIVEDRGGAIKGNRIDIYFDTHEEALAFGVQYIEVFQVIN